MSDNTPALSQTELRRLEKLAQAAGRSPRAMLKFVLRDGFAETERVVKTVKQSQSDIEAGRTRSHTDLMTAADVLLGTHASRRRAA